ncbi:DUF4926 domain-containing protein [Micromonospora sp. NPDC050200]|uniref:DUF4926 domain-containing protein n=1 Tax=Micromonospora sp. NPDC050200 TaxID=3155664 RepID=UPI0033EB3FE3
MELFDVVEAVVDLPDHQIRAGAVGTIVHVFEQPNLAYEVEFSDDEGRTIAMTALTPDKVRPHR